MKGEKTMCTLVGENKTEGLIVSRLFTHSRVHLIVAVKEALVLLPISYVVRIANYRVSWKLVLDKDQFLMTDSWGDDVPVTEQEDLTFISKSTFWRVGHDLFHFANKVEGMDWTPCTVFSSMQNINQKHHGTPEWKSKYEEGLSLLQFSVEIYRDQVARGKFFLHEHPATASSWDLQTIKELAEHPGVLTVTGDMCRWVVLRMLITQGIQLILRYQNYCDRLRMRYP